MGTTTDIVRNVYSDESKWTPLNYVPGTWANDFDEWLADVKQQAVREFVESAVTPEKIKELSDMHLADSVRELQAQAWEHGYAQGTADEMTKRLVDSPNPYRWEEDA